MATDHTIVAYFGPAIEYATGREIMLSTVDGEVSSTAVAKQPAESFIELRDRGTFKFLLTTEDYDERAHQLDPQQRISVKNCIALLSGKYIGVDAEGNAIVLTKRGTEIHQIDRNGVSLTLLIDRSPIYEAVFEAI